MPISLRRPAAGNRLVPTIGLIAALVALAGPFALAQGMRAPFPDSIRPVSTAPGNGPYVTRTVLSADEAAAPMTLSIVLKMRNFADLQTQLAAGRLISRSEMVASYLPLASDYQRVAAWLEGQGLTPTLPDPNNTTITATGTVGQIAKVLKVSFARVAIPGAGGAAPTEYTSAISVPSLPGAVAGPVLGVNKLQPHLRFHHAPASPAPFSSLRPQDVVAGSAYITPNDVAAAYNMPGAWTGKGQTIAIVDQGSVLNSDLDAFWSAIGSAQTASNLTVVDVDGGPIDNSDPETALDVEWAGALAPGAQIRLYLAPDPVDDPLPQILDDLASFPTMKVVSISYGSVENQSEIKQGAVPLSQIQSVSQEIAQLAAAGVTVLAAAGDSGSNPDPITGDYSASSPLSVNYPASDPDAAGVGGTTMSFNASWTDTGEVVWNQLSSGEALASGGGISDVFSIPTWQTGTPTTAGRCVPDVVAPASGTSASGPLGALIVVTARNSPGEQAVAGTSVSCPIWAGIVTRINQARAASGLSSLGILGPHLYPLLGSNAFNDITSGSNGAYTAKVGYDLASGIGSPNVANLMADLGGGTPPTITSEPQSESITVGSLFSFSVTATGAAPLTYQWSLNGVPISGATNATYSNASAVSASAGSYVVVVSNAFGSATSTAATLTVNIAPSTESGGAPPGGSSGGGSPSLWFYGALALLVAAREILRRRNAAANPG